METSYFDWASVLRTEVESSPQKIFFNNEENKATDNAKKSMIMKTCDLAVRSVTETLNHF
jgi:hypothetical protein